MIDLSLRAMEPEDLDLLYRIENDTELWNLGITNVPYSRYLLHDYMSNTTGDIYTDKQVRLIIEDSLHNIVGITDITNFDARNCRAEVGIVIQSPYRRKGYALATLSHMAHYARNVLHLHQLYACISVENKASMALFLKAGFQQTAVFRDWLFDGKRYYDAAQMQLLL